MKTINIVSISGGKDSTATLLKAIESGAENIRVVFCDTGHENPQTYAYVHYLERFLGLPIQWIKADWSAAIARKRKKIAGDQRHGRNKKDGRKVRWSNKAKRRALEVLHPTGNPFLDMCMCRGRFPSTMARFCTEELKTLPFRRQVLEPVMASKEFDRINVWVGVRADESAARANLSVWEAEFADPDTGAGLWTYRPILDWTADQVFAYHRQHGVEPNPLYLQGMGRVGCMPCVNARKSEMKEIARRFPEEIDRIEHWEEIVGKASKRGCSTFWPARGVRHVSLEKHGIRSVIDWSRTSRGGRQFDLIAVSEASDETPMCQSLYGLCE